MIVLYHKLRVFCKSDARFVWYNQVVPKKPIHEWREPLMNMTAAMEARTNKPLTACTDQEIYLALLDIVREQSAARVRPVTGRKLYYISAEFLIGKLLSNNLINLGLYDDTRAALAAAAEPARRRCRPAVSLRPVPPVLQGRRPERATRPVADRPLLGGKNGYGLSRRAGRQDLQRPSVQAGRHGLRGPHEHAESVRSRHH